MNSKNAVIKVLYAALTGEKQQLDNDINLQELWEIANKHKIVPIIYYGALNCGISNDEPIMQQLFMTTCRNVAVSQRQAFYLNEIFNAFDEKGVEYMPLKGTLLKELYPKSEMRIMGDADIVIKTAQYDIIKPIMEELGYSEKVESDHELIWKKPGSFIELHKRLIPSYNKDYFAYYGDGWQLAKIKNGTRYEMTDEDQMIYLFTHYAKHYRDAGIGIKHIVDLWVYRKNKPGLDEEYIKKELENLKLYDFYCNTIKTLSVWFDGENPDDVTDFITRIIFNSGVYGTDEARILSQAVKAAKSHGTAKNVKSSKLRKLIFLNFDSMCVKYPFLRKLPFLLPVMWVVRIFSALLFKRNNIKKQSQKLSSITEEGINSYQQSLDFVGLDFNFKE